MNILEERKNVCIKWFGGEDKMPFTADTIETIYNDEDTTIFSISFIEEEIVHCYLIRVFGDKNHISIDFDKTSPLKEVDWLINQSHIKLGSILTSIM